MNDEKNKPRRINKSQKNINHACKQQHKKTNKNESTQAKQHGSNTNSGPNQLFREAIGQVRRYYHNKIEPNPARPKPIPRKKQEDEQQVFIDMFSDEYSPDESHATDQLFFARAGLQNSVIRKLKRGHYNLDAEIDLHGLTLKSARQQLAIFLDECIHNNWRCVRIIHGKGRRSGGQGPVLKQNVNYWLPQRDDVLAFCSTIPAHGGTGAIYVLLRRKR